MKKKWIFILGMLLFSSILIAQNDHKPRQDWFDGWKRATVMLGGVKIQNGAETFEALGTGLLICNYVAEDGDPPIILTAKHIINNLPAIHVRPYWGFEKTLEDDLGFMVPLRDKNKLLYFTHPDPKVDLAAFPFNYSHPAKGAKIEKPFSIVPKSAMSEIISLELGDIVGTFGYPANLAAVGSVYRTKPLYRQGVVSWVPSKDDTLNSEILIDIPSYPGNSGGPAIIISRFTPNQLTVEPFKATFVGIVSRFVPQIIEAQDIQGWYRTTIVQNSGLTVIVPADRVLEIIQYIKDSTN